MFAQWRLQTGNSSSWALNSAWTWVCREQQSANFLLNATECGSGLDNKTPWGISSWDSLSVPLSNDVISLSEHIPWFLPALCRWGDEVLTHVKGQPFKHLSNSSNPLCCRWLPPPGASSSNELALQQRGGGSHQQIKLRYGERQWTSNAALPSSKRQYSLHVHICLQQMSVIILSCNRLERCARSHVHYRFLQSSIFLAQWTKQDKARSYKHTICSCW